MIRHGDGLSAFGDILLYFSQHRHRIMDWFDAVARTAEGVVLSQAATALVEARLGRAVSGEARLALAWLVNVLIDMDREIRAAEDAAGHRPLTQIAQDNVVALVRSRAIQQFTQLPPHAASQLSMLLGHLDKHHFR